MSALPDDGVPLPALLAFSDPVARVEQTPLGAPVPPGYVEMVDQLRTLLDRVAGAAPDAATVARTTATLAELNEVFAACQVDEPRQLSGRLVTVPGRAQLAVPPLHIDHLDDHHLVGHVRYGRHFLGSNGVVHGGAIPLLFDDVLGRFALAGGRSRSRTAYLHVDFRSVTPIDTDLRLEAHFDREDGRKRHLSASLHHGDRLCAEATALFVALRPGQT